MAQAVTAINSFKDVLGISAAAVSTSGIDFRSTDFGSDQFVSMKIVEDAGVAGANMVQGGATAAYTYTGTSTAVADGATVRDTGQDVGGTINGVLATGKGRTLAIASDFLDTSITLASGTAGAAGSTNAFTVTGGGASFQLSSKVNIGGKTTLGVQSVATRKLGRTEVVSGATTCPTWPAVSTPTSSPAT
jgi:flagellin